MSDNTFPFLFYFPFSLCLFLAIYLILPILTRDLNGKHARGNIITIVPKKREKGHVRASENFSSIQYDHEHEETRERERRKERKRAAHDPPEIRKLESLLDSIRKSDARCRWDSLIAIGDMYQRGSFPRFLPNPDMAMKCYKTAALSPEAAFSGIAQTKYIESYTTQIGHEDRDGAPLPEHFAERACEQAYASFLRTPMNAFEKPIIPKRERPYVLQGPHDHDGPQITTMNHPFRTESFEGPHEENLMNMYFPPRRMATGNPVPVYKHDSQNVHDHAISSATDHNLRDLMKQQEEQKEEPEKERRTSTTSKDTTSNQSEGRGGKDELVQNVERAILASEDLTPAQRADAFHVLHDLGHDIHSKYGVSERDALASVWGKIQSLENSDSLAETLAKQLASGVEAGSVVCSSGKISRIVSALDGVSNEATARPMWMVREELGSLAAKVRENFGGDDAMDEDRAKHEFGNRARQQYIDELGMSPGVVEPLIEEYSYGF